MQRRIFKAQPFGFSWDETPREVFGRSGLELVRQVRKTERELATFLQEWYGRRGVTGALNHDRAS